ncbi:fungal-specific transcription factor domain-containing protein [Chlamydoabsidia padenii]|nr:fungal-specific transcription factor domain-containing protein [Chlamydoabsidia padenii]
MENDNPTLSKDPTITSSSSPNNNQEKTGSSSGKRVKSTHACDLCKKKKVKCDGQYPCARCQKSNLSCTFNQHKLKRVSSRSYVNTHEQRLRNLEKALDCLQVDPIIPHQTLHQQYNHPSSGSVVATQAPIEKFNTSSIGQPYYARDWNTRLDRLPATFDKMTLLDNEPRRPGAFALPAMTIHHDLLNIYFTHVQPYFPMIHKESFLHHLHEASPLLLNGMYAVAHQWASIDSSDFGSGHGTTKTPSATTAGTPPATAKTTAKETVPPGLKYYQDAISLVELYTDAPRLSTIQGLLLIIKYNELVQRPGFFHRTRFYFDLVVKMCKDLGLPRMLPPTCQVHPVLAEQRRRIFWAAYIYDLLFSTELGTPTLFTLDECTVEFPNLMDDERNAREQHDTVLYFHWMTMVMKAQGAVLHYLRSKHNNTNDVYGQLHSLHQHMMGLRSELQLWQEPARGRVNFLFLAYHFTNILLYRSVTFEINNNNNNNNNIGGLSTLLGMDQDGLGSFLLEEANAIVIIVDQLLKDHTVACLHYSFRGVQQIIHYLTGAVTVYHMYQGNENNIRRVNSIIRQLIPLTPVVEMQSMDLVNNQQQQKHTDHHIQPGNRVTSLVYSPLSTLETSSGENRHHSQQTQRQPPSSSSSSSSSSFIPSPSLTVSRSPSPLITTGTPTTQQLNDLSLDNQASSTSIQHRHGTHQSTTHQQSIVPSKHIPDHSHPPLLLDTSTLSLLYQPSSSSSDPSSITTTPSLVSALSSTSSLSTIASTPIDPSGLSSTSAHRSIHLRRSHQQLRNVSTSSLPHRLSYSSDLRSSGNYGLPLHHHHHHHPYMTHTLTQSPTATISSGSNGSTSNNSNNHNAITTLNPALLQQQQQHTPRRHTVSSGQSSPSTSSLPSSPLHRMTLSDDPWIQVSQQQQPQPQQNLPIPRQPSVEYYPSTSSSHQHDMDQKQQDMDQKQQEKDNNGLDDMHLLEDDQSLSKVPSTIIPLEGSMMMDLLQQPIDSPWDQQHQHYHQQ